MVGLPLIVDVFPRMLGRGTFFAAWLLDADRAIDTLTTGGRIDPTKLQAPLGPLFPSVVQGFLVSAFALIQRSLSGRSSCLYLSFKAHAIFRST